MRLSLYFPDEVFKGSVVNREYVDRHFTPTWFLINNEIEKGFKKKFAER